MTDHYEIHLIHSLQMLEGEETLPEWADSPTRLHFEVGVGNFTLEASTAAMGFSTSDTNIVIPSSNVAIMQVWED